MKILLSAFACGPGQGSEPGIGWNWALEAARQGHDVTVITQTELQEDIEAAIAAGQVPSNVTFDFYIPRWLEILRDRGTATPLGSLTWHIVHLLWQFTLLGHVRRRHLAHNYDVAHHITLGGIRHPTLLQRLPLPLVVGPLGGGERAPYSLRKSFPWSGWIKDLIRDLHTSLLRIDPITRSACRDALVVYAKTQHSKEALPSPDDKQVRVKFEIGSYARPLEVAPDTNMSGPLRVFYAGQFLYWKGMHLGLRSVAEACRKGSDIRLTMAGSGPQEAEWQAIAKDLGIDDRINWVGRLPHDEMAPTYQAHDLFLFPSLHDSSGNVVLEAITNALPVICLDLGGPAEIISESCGRVVPADGLSEAECVTGLADALQAFDRDRGAITPLRQGALTRAGDFQWSKVVGNLYQDVEALLSALPARTNATPDQSKITLAKVGLSRKNVGAQHNSSGSR